MCNCAYRYIKQQVRIRTHWLIKCKNFEDYFFITHIQSSVADLGYLHCPDPTDPKSRRPRIRIRIKEFKYFKPEKLSKNYLGCSSRIRNFSHTGSRGKKHRIPDLEPQHWQESVKFQMQDPKRSRYILQSWIFSSLKQNWYEPQWPLVWKFTVSTGNLVYFCWLLPAECLFPPHLSCQTKTVNIISAASLRFSAMGCHSSDWVGEERVFSRYLTAKDDGFWRFRISPRPTVPPKN